MFWNKLTQDQADEYWRLVQACKPWLGWASLSDTKKALIEEPREPTDIELHRMEILAMIGWGMI